MTWLSMTLAGIFAAALVLTVISIVEELGKWIKRRIDGKWQCACGEWTSRSHWRSGADGAGFHASADAPPSDLSPKDDGTNL